MALTPFQPPQGFYSDGSIYSAKGKWYTGNLVRFKEGYPQKFAGWAQAGVPQFLGTARGLHSWQDLETNAQLAIGTNLKYYVATNFSDLIDITPTRAMGNLGSNPVATQNGSATLTITDSAHGAILGDFVTFAGLSGTFGGVSAALLNTEFEITSIIDINTYTILGPTIASGTTSGGGAGATATYQLNIGSNLATAYGAGWGSGPWGRGTWGSSFNEPVQVALWSQDNFGQDLVFCPRGGGIYYWAANSAPPAVNISTLSGASDTPVVANLICVSPSDQRVFAFGVNKLTDSVLDPLLIRWSTDGSASNWTPLITNSAGELRLSTGSTILAALVGTGQVLVWTESSLHALIFVGGDLVYGLQTISTNIDLVGPNAVATQGDFAMWMGATNFYLYDGVVHTPPCSVRQYVFGNINLQQSYKICASSNKLAREIIFFYPSANSTENDSYVIYNYQEQCWYYGLMTRTAWIDSGIISAPQAASTDGYIYLQETGLDDGSTSPPTPLNSYIQSGPIEIGEGDSFLFMGRIIPDITYLGSTANTPSVNYTVAQMDYPGGPSYTQDTDQNTSVSVEMDQFTEVLYTRIRGRQFNLTIKSDATEGNGINWRLGIQRFDVQPDGRR